MKSRSRRIVIVVAVILMILSVLAISINILKNSNKDSKNVSQAENVEKITCTTSESFSRNLKSRKLKTTTEAIMLAKKVATTKEQPQSTTISMTTENETQESTCEVLIEEATTEFRNQLSRRIGTVYPKAVPATTEVSTVEAITTQPVIPTTQVVTSVKETIPETIPETILETVNEEPTLELVKSKYINTISYDMDVTVLSGFSLEEFKTLMEGIALDDANDFYKVNAETIYNLCNQYQINEIFFCGIISAESWWGTAENCVAKNNFTGMMGNGELIRYETAYDNLEATAQNLHENYLSPGGSFNNGTTISGVSVCYCGPEWPPLVWERMTQIIE
ncbi:MAG: hypothetical protein J6J60_01545 [Clostridia bacterium]|nr:hypothetical protein [Clostridia bacterium]